MTQGHKHHIVRAPRLIRRALTAPLWRTENLARVDASPYPYGVILNGERIPDGKLPKIPDPAEVYYLSALSILHRWTGLCLKP